MAIESKCQGCGGTELDYECPRCMARKVEQLELQIRELERRLYEQEPRTCSCCGQNVILCASEGCAKDMKRLNGEYKKLLWVLARDAGLSLSIDKKALETIPEDAELLKWDEPMFNAVMLKGICKSAEVAKAIEAVKVQQIERPVHEWVESAESGTVCQKCGLSYFVKDKPCEVKRIQEPPYDKLFDAASRWTCVHCGSRRLDTELHDGFAHCLDCCNNTKVG